MRTVTNNHGISMILLRTGTKSIMRFELCEKSDQKVTSRADEIRGPTPYDGREGMLLRLSKKGQEFSKLGRRE